MKKLNLAAALAVMTMSMSAYAVPVDTALVTLGATTTLNGATYTQSTVSPAGTGTIPSFVTIGGNQNEVQGYNTTVNNVFNNGSSDSNNHEITVGTIGFIDINGAAAGGQVMRFMLDINQTNSGDTHFLSLDEVQIFVSTNPNQSGSVAPAQGASLALLNSALIYQMDTSTVDNRIKLDAQIGGGSGAGDMFLDIPLSMFTSGFSALGLNTLAAQNGAFIYVYSRFGSQFTNNDGFEEWGAIQGAALVEQPCVPGTLGCGQQQVPEPGNLALLAIGLLGIGTATRMRRKV
jgi:hypothetical protein